MSTNQTNQYYKQSVEQLSSKFKVDVSTGLSQNGAEERQKEFGKNELKQKRKLSAWKILLRQFKDVLLLVLIAAATISLIINQIEGEGAAVEAALIYAIVIGIAIIGFFNEYKAERTVAALKKLVSHNARVIRDGQQFEISAIDLVPGDLMILEEGQKIPADARLIKANNLRIIEASLTGESEPQSKKVDILKEDNLALGDQKNMIFSGTVVAAGTGISLVVATGEKAEIGKIASLVSSVEEHKTPIQQRLDELGKKLGIVVSIICAITFLAIFFLQADNSGDETLQRLAFAFTVAVALAVAAIPEGLAFVVRLVLALGARRMAKRNALVRKLSAVESLGSTDIICSDKTGTLTKGEMTVREIAIGKKQLDVTGQGYEMNGEILHNGEKHKIDSDLKQLLLIGALVNNAKADDGDFLGDPTEISLMVAARKLGVTKDEVRALPREFEIPFTSERKMMTTVHEVGGKWLVATKGAPETILNKVSHFQFEGQVVDLSPELRQALNKQVDGMTKKALRVLAIAAKEYSEKPTDEQAEENLVLLGFVGIMDPPRQEVKKVVERVQSEAGMRVIMITGDNAMTAEAIGREVGIRGKVISGTELDEISQQSFVQQVQEIGIYARVNPEHKIRIVKALQKQGHQVAMTGDGVNDAPALKAADIGVAMGITGTDASKEASDLILLDDQFLTIIAAIEEGRGIFDNMRKFVNFLLSTNIAEVSVVLIGLMLHGNLLLTAAQILFINIVTDGLPAVALGSDAISKKVMSRKPKEFQQAIINRRTWSEIAVFGVLMSVVVMVLYDLFLKSHGTIIASSMVFVSIVIFTFARLIDIRSDYKVKWLSNPWLTFSVISSLAITILVLYVPFLAELFNAHPIPWTGWGLIFVGSVLLITIMKLLNPVLDSITRQREI